VTSFAGAAFAIALLANLVAVIGWATVAWLLGRRLGRVNIIDVFWGPGFGLIAVVTAVVAVITGTGNSVRQIVLLVLVLGWGSRLGWHVGRRSAGHGEDPRYGDLLRKHGQDRDRTVWTFVYLPQMFTLFVVSLSVQVAMFIKPGVGPLGWTGVALAITGIAFESIGDAQMSRFKADPANKGKLIDVGLWRYTRHPNYFGDACLWTGVAKVSQQLGRARRLGRREPSRPGSGRAAHRRCRCGRRAWTGSPRSPRARPAVPRCRLAPAATGPAGAPTPRCSPAAGG
jgi:steroid 5-alpha reductase family enzyme